MPRDDAAAPAAEAAEADGLWARQRRYFDEQGPDAWRLGDVPHYVTCHPAMAEAYAALIRGFLADRARIAGPADPAAPLHVIELGAGSGRFAYHFLCAIERRCQALGEPWPALRYVLTDVSEAILESWAAHPWLARFLEAGRLDIAAFDVERPRPLELRIGGATIAPGALVQPPVVIGNYLFDTIPQDVFQLRDGAVWRAHHDVIVPDGAASLTSADISWRYEPLAAAPYAEPPLDRLFESYRQALRDTHLVFPATGLRALDWLGRLSQQGLLLLAGDKGPLTLDALEGQGRPFVARHGSVSLPVNFHALAQACEAAGGLALRPARSDRSLNVVALVQTAEAAAHRHVQAAYLDVIAPFGPDGAYDLFCLARSRLDTLTFAEIVTALRFSHDDAHQFACFLPRLMALAESLDAEEQRELAELCERVWAGYFPLGEPLDLAAAIAGLLYAIDAYRPALVFFERSLSIYGPDTGSLFNMAACHRLLDEDAAAAALLRRVVAADPANAPAHALLAECG